MLKHILYFCLLHIASSGFLPSPKDGPIKNNCTNLDGPLILTPLINSGKIQEARNAAYVFHPELQFIQSYSGFFNVEETSESNMFFWFFLAEHFEEKPVILWLNGGPGASSLLGLFQENGPYIIENDGRITSRNVSWTKLHSVLYIDNPVGAGFSTTKSKLLENQVDIGLNLYEALQQFFKLFPELIYNDFYITGESYAGKYIPALAYAIYTNNPKADQKINLKGFAIGNGYSDPMNQIGYNEYFYQLGLVNKQEKQVVAQAENDFINCIRNEEWMKAYQIFDHIVSGNDTVKSLFEKYSGLQNPYNFLFTYNQYQEMDDNMKVFINRCDIRDALHVGNVGFYKSNANVLLALREDLPKSVAPWISELLNHMRVLIYNGQMDIVCPYSLTANYLYNLDFVGADEFKVAQKRIWKVGDYVAGYYMKSGNLTFVMVRDAGHMVPADQPEYAFDLIKKFTHTKEF